MKKVLKRTSVILLVVVMSSSMAFAAVTFSDVKESNWFYGPVNAAVEKDIIKGYPDGSFKPDNTLTYGEFIKMMVLLKGEDPGNAENNQYGWAYSYYEKGIELGLFIESDISKFDLNEKITREYMALIISNYLGDITVSDYDKIQSKVKDVNSSNKNEYHIIKAYAEGILTGYSDNTFKPENTLSRSEAAAAIQRALDPSERIKPDLTEPEKDTIEIENNGSTIVVDFEASKSGKASDVISNMEIINYPQKFIEGYILVSDPKPFDITVEHGILTGDEYIKGKFLSSAVLIKNGKVITELSGNRGDNGYFHCGIPSLSQYWVDDMSEYIKNGTLPDFDYIGTYRTSYDTSEGTIYLIPNPFK